MTADFSGYFSALASKAARIVCSCSIIFFRFASIGKTLGERFTSLHHSNTPFFLLFSNAKVRRFHMGIIHQLFSSSLNGDGTALDHIATVNDRQQWTRVLVGDEYCDSRLADMPNSVDDLELKRGGQAQERLIQQQQTRFGHQRSADSQHLLLAAT